MKLAGPLLGSALAVAALVTQAAAAPLPYVGVSLSGAEYNGQRATARPNVDYVYPQPEDLDYFFARGLTTIRLPFRWERLQPTLYGDLDGAELARIDAVVAATTERGGALILDPHNYARYGAAVIGSPDLPDKAFADFWQRLAGHYGISGVLGDWLGKGLEDVHAQLAQHPGEHGTRGALEADEARRGVHQPRALGEEDIHGRVEAQAPLQAVLEDVVGHPHHGVEAAQEGDFGFERGEVHDAD